MKLGDLIYGQLIVANKDMEPELVCIDLNYRSVGMGPLPSGGIFFTVPLQVTRQIIDPDCPFLLRLSHYINFTIVVGFNGRIWLKAAKNEEMVALMHVISMLEFMSVEEADSNMSDLITSFLIQNVT